MAIPFNAMKFEPKDGASLIANFCRSRYLKSNDNAMQLQTWSPLLIRGFHDVEKFGTVTLAGKSNDVLFSSFEGPQDTPSFKPTGPLCVAGFVKENASDGKMSLRLELKKSDDFLGITVKVGDLSDWSNFATLKADIFVVQCPGVIGVGGGPFQSIKRQLQQAGNVSSEGRLKPGNSHVFALPDQTRAVGRRLPSGGA